MRLRNPETYELRPVPGGVRSTPQAQPSPVSRPSFMTHARHEVEPTQEVAPGGQAVIRVRSARMVWSAASRAQAEPLSHQREPSPRMTMSPDRAAMPPWASSSRRSDALTVLAPFPRGGFGGPGRRGCAEPSRTVDQFGGYSSAPYAVLRARRRTRTVSLTSVRSSTDETTRNWWASVAYWPCALPRAASAASCSAWASMPRSSATVTSMPICTHPVRSQETCTFRAWVLDVYRRARALPGRRVAQWPLRYQIRIHTGVIRFEMHRASAPRVRAVPETTAAAHDGSPGF